MILKSGIAADIGFSSNYTKYGPLRVHCLDPSGLLLLWCLTHSRLLLFGWVPNNVIRVTV